MADYFETEARLREALEYKRQHPSASFRWLDRQFQVNKDRIHRRWKGIQSSRSECNSTNLKLDKYQEKAFSWYLTRLWEIGVPLRQKTITTTANEILAAAAGVDKPSVVGENWATRWMAHHTEFKIEKKSQLR